MQLQTLFHTPVGEITQLLILVGFGGVLMDEQDQRARQQLGRRVGYLNDPDAPGTVLATLLYYPLETIALIPQDCPIGCGGAGGAGLGPGFKAG